MGSSQDRELARKSRGMCGFWFVAKILLFVTGFRGVPRRALGRRWAAAMVSLCSALGSQAFCSLGLATAWAFGTLPSGSGWCSVTVMAGSLQARCMSLIA